VGLFFPLPVPDFPPPYGTATSSVTTWKRASRVWPKLAENATSAAFAPARHHDAADAGNVVARVEGWQVPQARAATRRGCR
jgi:hypothetical protein